jgi:DNA end-binding protein Ku
MAPRANWKGFLRLSLVTCPIALFPATSESDKISFNQINKKTGHRIRYLKVDADTGEEVSNEDIIKGYQVDKDRYLEVTKDELENIALELAQLRLTRLYRVQRSMTFISSVPTISCQMARLGTMPTP